MDRCPICDQVVQQAEMGRKRVYCCPSHRQLAYLQRHGLRPTPVVLGVEQLVEWGLEDVSLAQLLREAGNSVV